MLGHNTLLSDYPNIASEIKEDFLTGDFKNPGWENEFGYPVEEFLDDCFAGIYHEKMREYITSITQEYFNCHYQLDSKQKEEAVIFVSTEIYGYFSISQDITYGERNKIQEFVKDNFERNIKDKNISFDDGYLVGKLINVLDDPKKTEEIISILSKALTNKEFSSFFGGYEFIEVFQAMRPALMKLYAEKDFEDYYDWFEKPFN